MLRDLLGEGALSSIVVARLGHLEASGPDKVKSFVAKLIGFWAVVLVGLAFLGMLLTPYLVGVLATGFKDHPEQFELTLKLTRTIFPYMALVGLCALFMGILHHKKIFGWPAAASIFFNLTWITLMVIYGEYIHIREPIKMVYVIALCVVFGGVMQWLCLWPALFKTGLSFKPQFDFFDSEVLKVLKMLGPAILSVAAVQINVAVNVAMATTLGEGGPTSINFAFRIMQLPVGIVGVSVATVLLPKLSEHVAQKNHAAFGEALSEAIRKVTFLTFPAICGLCILGPDLIGALYQRGKFTAEATQMVWLALQGYLFGILPYVLNKNLIQAFFAHSDTRFPVWVSFISIVINFSLNYTLVYIYAWGVQGLTLGTSFVLLINCAMLYLGLKIKHKLRLPWRKVSKTWGLQLICSIIMALGLISLNSFMVVEWVEAKVLLNTLVGAGVYFGIMHFLSKANLT